MEKQARDCEVTRFFVFLRMKEPLSNDAIILWF